MSADLALSLVLLLVVLVAAFLCRHEPSFPPATDDAWDDLLTREQKEAHLQGSRRGH